MVLEVHKSSYREVKSTILSEIRNIIEEEECILSRRKEYFGFLFEKDKDSIGTSKNSKSNGNEEER